MEFPIRKLLKHRAAFEPLVWWENLFGKAFSSVQPFLAPCDDRRAALYPSPDIPSVQLTVRESGRRYLAFPSDELADEVDDLILDWEDVQAYRFSCTRLRAALRKVFRLKSAAGRQIANLCYIGRCECNKEFRHVYACLSESAQDAHAAIENLTDSKQVGCVLFPTHHTKAADLLKSRGIASVALRECLTLKKDGFHGECPVNCSDCMLQDLSNTDLKNHLDRRLDTLGVEFASLKKENGQLKGQLAQVNANIAKTVEPEYFKWIYMILASGSVSKAASALKLPNSTFAKRLKTYAARGGLYQTLFALTTVRKGCGVKSVEHYNPEYAAHQSSDFQTVDSVQELLDGLEALNAANWQKLRDELIELVRSDFR